MWDIKANNIATTIPQNKSAGKCAPAAILARATAKRIKTPIHLKNLFNIVQPPNKIEAKYVVCPLGKLSKQDTSFSIVVLAEVTITPSVQNGLLKANNSFNTPIIIMALMTVKKKLKNLFVRSSLSGRVLVFFLKARYK